MPDQNKTRFTPCVELPPTVTVPVTVWFCVIRSESVLTAVPTLVIAPNVCAALIVGWPGPVNFSVRPFQLNAADAKVTSVPLIASVAVFAVTVRLPT